MLKQAQNDPRMKEAENMSIPVIGGGGSWGNNIAEEDSMVSHATEQSFVEKNGDCYNVRLPLFLSTQKLAEKF